MPRSTYSLKTISCKFEYNQMLQGILSMLISLDHSLWWKTWCKTTPGSRTFLHFTTDSVLHWVCTFFVWRGELAFTALHAERPVYSKSSYNFEPHSAFHVCIKLPLTWIRVLCISCCVINSIQNRTYAKLSHCFGQPIYPCIYRILM